MSTPEAAFRARRCGALKAERLLGAMVPAKLGGEGAGVTELAEVCHRLGQGCASTAMIFAMHQIKAACLVNHYQDSALARRLPARGGDQPAAARLLQPLKDRAAATCATA